MDDHALLKKITILDFMLTDIGLYLNTHPNDKEALQKYNCIVEEAQKVRCEYEKICGPLVSFRSEGTHGWKWKNCPWPWEEEFNFKLRGDR